MKKTGLYFLLVALVATPISASKYDEFNKHFSDGNREGARRVLDSWGENKLSDPQYYICEFNYHIALSRKKRALPLPDEGKEIGEIVGHAGGTVSYDRKIAARGIEFMKKGVSRFPDHYEMRFSLLWIYRELKNYTEYMGVLQASLDYFASRSPKRLFWSKNEVIEDPYKFLTETLQRNFYDLIKNGKGIRDRQFFYRYSDLMIKYFPTHKYGYSNKGLLYYDDNNPEEGIKFLLSALEKDPLDELVLYNVGYYYQVNGDKEKATHYYNVIIDEGQDEEFINLAQDAIDQMASQDEEEP